MGTYPNSTDPGGWYLRGPDWSVDSKNYTPIFGEKGADDETQVSVLKMDTATTESYTTSKTQMKSSSNTNSLTITAGASVGFLGISANVSASHSSEFTTSTEFDSTITKDVTCYFNMSHTVEPC